MLLVLIAAKAGLQNLPYLQIPRYDVQEIYQDTTEVDGKRICLLGESADNDGRARVFKFDLTAAVGDNKKRGKSREAHDCGLFIIQIRIPKSKLTT